MVLRLDFFHEECFVDGVRKRSWLQMLNPLSRNRRSPAEEVPEDGNDLESPVSSPDATGYIGKKEILISLKPSQFFISDSID